MCLSYMLSNAGGCVHVYGLHKRSKNGFMTFPSMWMLNVTACEQFLPYEKLFLNFRNVQIIYCQLKQSMFKLMHFAN